MALQRGWVGVFKDLEGRMEGHRAWVEMEEEGKPFHSEPCHLDPAKGLGCASAYTGKPLEYVKWGCNVIKALWPLWSEWLGGKMVPAPLT